MLMIAMCAGPSNLRQQALEKNGRLCQLERSHGLELFISASPSPLGVSEYMVATAVEAIFGAVFCDCGKVWATMERTMISFGVFEVGQEMNES